jgi:hypothetical protein
VIRGDFFFFFEELRGGIGSMWMGVSFSFSEGAIRLCGDGSVWTVITFFSINELGTQRGDVAGVPSGKQ